MVCAVGNTGNCDSYFALRLYKPRIGRHNVTVPLVHGAVATHRTSLLTALLVVIGVGHHLYPFFLPLTPSELEQCVILYVCMYVCI
jgi:hypothetical protein